MLEKLSLLVLVDEEGNEVWRVVYIFLCEELK